ncbi:MAG: Mrp/NBP35 family ATP-binding protein [Kosmotogaceae bacterium]
MAQNEKLQERMKKIKENIKSIKHKLLVMSGKGGVGKSTVAVNLAVALADEGYNVGLLDIDLHGPNVAMMLDITGKPEVLEGQILPQEPLPNLKVVSLANFIEIDVPVIWRGPMKTSAIYQFLGDVAWGDLDFLVIDAPPGTGDESLTILQTIQDIKSILVTTPQNLSAGDVSRAFNFVRSLKKDVVGFVENMSYLRCPNCGEKILLFGQGAGDRLSKDYDIPLLESLPFDPQVVVNSDNGKGIVSHMRGSELEKSYRRLIKNIFDALEGNGK